METTLLLQNTQGGTKVTCLVDCPPGGGLFGRLRDRFRLRGEMSRIYAEGLSKLKVAIED